MTGQGLFPNAQQLHHTRNPGKEEVFFRWFPFVKYKTQKKKKNFFDPEKENRKKEEVNRSHTEKEKLPKKNPDKRRSFFGPSSLNEPRFKKKR